jgi:HEAT repeat
MQPHPLRPVGYGMLPVVLEGLSDVAWAGLEHAHGSAADVPGLLRALRAAEPEVRKKAQWHLYGNIFHQGTRYEASAYAAPFLIELLADPATPERNEILGLLTSLAIGYDESWLPGPFPVASYRQRAVGGEQVLRAAPAPTGDEDDGRYQYWESLDEQDQDRMFAHVELSAYDAVRAGVPLYCALLADEDPAVRIAAAYALAWFGEDAFASVGPLTSAAGDPRMPVAATALVALGLVGTADPIAVRVVRAAVTDDRDLVRWAAAVALARLHGPAADPAVAAELLAWTGGDNPAHREVPYLDGDVSGLAGLALRQLGDAHAEAAFDALLSRIPTVDGPESLPIVGEALRRAFPDGRLVEGTRFADLDTRQQRLLRTLAASPSTWGWGQAPVFGNFMGMVLAYGLPYNPEAMRTFVTGP